MFDHTIFNYDCADTSSSFNEPKKPPRKLAEIVFITKNEYKIAFTFGYIIMPKSFNDSNTRNDCLPTQ